MVVYGQKWLCLDKVVLLGQTGCIRIMWLYLGKVVVFGHIGIFPAKFFFSGGGCCIWAKWL